MKELKIMTEYITLDAALKFAGIASTGGEAKMRIADGGVKVNDEVCLMRGKKLRPGDRISAEGEDAEMEEYQIK